MHWGQCNEVLQLALWLLWSLSSCCMQVSLPAVSFLLICCCFVLGFVPCTFGVPPRCCMLGLLPAALVSWACPLYIWGSTPLLHAWPVASCVGFLGLSLEHLGFHPVVACLACCQLHCSHQSMLGSRLAACLAGRADCCVYLRCMTWSAPLTKLIPFFMFVLSCTVSWGYWPYTVLDDGVCSQHIFQSLLLGWISVDPPGAPWASSCPGLVGCYARPDC